MLVMYPSYSSARTLKACNVKTILPFYYLGMIVLSRLLALLGPWIPSLREQTKARFMNKKQLDLLQAKRESFQQFFIFYASSAGEYEQALPVLQALTAKYKHAGAALILFSESGLRFAASQNEKNIIIKAPWDNLLSWMRLFSILKPTASFVVRYELWPGFLKVARAYGPVYLIDGVASQRAKRSQWSMALQSYLVGCFHKVFVVSDIDFKFFVDDLGYPRDQLIICGDTKYDRVRDRLAMKEEQRRALDAELAKSWGRKRRLILGSGWHKDIVTLLDAFKNFSGAKSWQLIIAPHDVKSKMIEWTERQCLERGLRVEKFSKSQSLEPAVSVLIIDSVGLLPELYGCSDIAFVGGAMHFRVHNVLEPAMRGLPVCFGPMYETSQEANYLVQQDLATVIRDVETLKKFWGDYAHSIDDEQRARRQEILGALCGASQRIVAEIDDMIVHARNIPVPAWNSNNSF